ncbi:hypothetical protein D3C71_437600 [compost metagenome]
MIVHPVARLPNGFLDLASLVPNAGGYEPDPVQRIHNAYCEIGIRKLPSIDVESFFKTIPPDFAPIKAAVTGYGSAYGEF